MKSPRRYSGNRELNFAQSNTFWPALLAAILFTNPYITVNSRSLQYIKLILINLTKTINCYYLQLILFQWLKFSTEGSQSDLIWSVTAVVKQAVLRETTLARPPSLPVMAASSENSKVSAATTIPPSLWGLRYTWRPGVVSHRRMQAQGVNHHPKRPRKEGKTSYSTKSSERDPTPQ